METCDWDADLAWLLTDARFAQVTTINAAGWPVTRTMGAPINTDWSVDLARRGTHRRIDHPRRNPRMDITGVGTPAPGASNDQPAVFDYGWLVPRAVILRGVAEFQDQNWALTRYRALTAEMAAQGSDGALCRSDALVRDELVGIRVRIVAVRAEGFGNAAQSFTRNWEDA